MNEKYPHFLSPMTIRGKTWRNRSVAAPMGGGEVKNGHMTEHGKYFIDFYTAGGPGEYILGETDISPVGSRAPADRYFELRDAQNQQGLREVAECIHSHGVLATVELCHCGATKIGGPGADIVGPSSYVRQSDGVQVHGMSREEIAQTVADFAEAAKIIRDCGFDGAVIHAGHEWLPHQFMSAKTNHRTDEYGGSIENRARLLVEILDAARAACGEDFILACRLSGSENEADPGYTQEESVAMCRIFAQHCDILHISAGRYYNPVDTKMMSSMFQQHGCNVDVAVQIKKQVDIPVAVVGGISDPVMCEEIIAGGKADFVVMGRQRLADPLFEKKCEEGREDEIRHCIRCMRCFPGPLEHVMAELAAAGPTPGPGPAPGGGPMPGEKTDVPMPGGGGSGDPLQDILEQLSRCTVNPEYKHGPAKSHPSPTHCRRVLVIGGGCAGMQAAITAIERGHGVTLIEKSDVLGGILNFAQDDPVKKDLAGLARAMEAQLRHMGADIRLNTPFSPQLLKKIAPDAVIAAVGSAVTGRDIPGIDGPNVINAMQAYEKGRVFPAHTVVLGGGQTGCETAEHIARAGGKVTLAAKHRKLCPDAYRLHGIKLRSLLAESGCEILYDTVCTAITPDGVMLKNTQSGEEAFLRADCVVNALGMQAVSCDAIRQACKGLAYYEIGDCVKARNICDALEEGYLTAVRL